jgi:hypothetical protein
MLSLPVTVSFESVDAATDSVGGFLSDPGEV